MFHDVYVRYFSDQDSETYYIAGFWIPAETIPLIAKWEMLLVDALLGYSGKFIYHDM